MGYEQSFCKSNPLEFSDCISEYSKRHSIVKHQKYKFQPYIKADFHKNMFQPEQSFGMIQGKPYTILSTKTNNKPKHL